MTAEACTIGPFDRPLRVALLSYRGNPTCGGQGVYVRHLSRALTRLGHEVTVLSGQPYPELAPGVGLLRVPSLDLYREPTPFRTPKRRELSAPVDLLELATMWTGGFPEPRTFSLRARALLAARLSDFDLVHDNQSLGTGLLGMLADGWPVLASVHHPISVDRRVDLAHATSLKASLSLRRWYGFAAMQNRVARRLPRLLTVSESSRADLLAELAIAPERVRVVPVGVDPSLHRPRPERARIPGRVMTTASADVPLKGLVPLLEALAKLRTERPEAHLVVVGRLRADSPTHRTIERLGLEGAVRFVAGESDERHAERYCEASCVVVPSLYEGFSLPAAEALACGTPLVATTGGALPEVAGEDGVHALLVPPGDPSALAIAILRLLEDRSLAARLAAAGRARVLERFTWQATAERTVAEYRALLAEHQRGSSSC
ncbi:MAG: glycosyltransferase family 4 protein [Actinomycetota bacterium]|nr:glycosyltransferase family 4 protein [Actinomycetota bacterium]